MHTDIVLVCFQYQLSYSRLKNVRWHAERLTIGHCCAPEQLHCANALNLQVAGTLLEGWNTILPKDFPIFGIFMMVVESTL